MARHILDALVLGRSLQDTGTTHDRILLATPCLLRHRCAAALSLFWDVQEQPHVDANVAMTCSPRFGNVFTKLRVMQLMDYAKVFLLDADTLVRHNIDEVFDMEAPSGIQGATGGGRGRGGGGGGGHPGKSLDF